MPATPEAPPHPADSQAHVLLVEARAMLGLPPVRPLSEVGLDELRRLTHSQLLATAQKLGLPDVATLGKDQLAARILDALRDAEQAEVAESDGGAEALRGRKFGHRPPEATGSAARESAAFPWGYGQDRVTAMAVDPDRLYVYWEVTDHAMARARAKLGAGGEGAWLDLRVYDTTGRLFDGTNANGYFDHAIERHDRQWFFHIGKPTSQAVVEVGLRSREGYFVKIARSGRVEFPRRDPAPETEPEWLTVTTSGDVHASGRGAPARPRFGGGGDAWGGGGGGLPAHRGADEQIGRASWHAWTFPWDEFLRSGEVVWEERFDWEAFFSTGFFEGYRSWSWEEGPHTITSWESGPFTYPVEVPPPTFQSFTGKVRTYSWPGGSRVVYGPWEVVIKGINGRAAKRTISRWQLHRSWLVGKWRERRGEVRVMGQPGAGSSGKLAMGASERVGLAASELRLGGASEVWYLGASEKRLGGSSEMLWAGASENVTRGASERRLQAASEYRLGGASETRLAGASGTAEHAPKGSPYPKAPEKTTEK